MEWIFITAVLVLYVYHRTFRSVVNWLTLITALGLGIGLAVKAGWVLPVAIGSLVSWGIWFIVMSLCLAWGITIAYQLTQARGRAILKQQLKGLWPPPSPHQGT